MSSNVVHMPVDHVSPDEGSSKAEAYLNNINSPKPKGSDFEIALKRRLQDSLLPIQEQHRHEFAMGQWGVMDAYLNDAMEVWNHGSIAEECIDAFQESLSYVLLCLIVPGDLAYTKPLLKLAQTNTKVAGAKAIYRGEEASLEKYRKARKLLADAAMSLGQASNCYRDQRIDQQED